MFNHWLFQICVFAILHLITVVSGFNGRCPAGWTYFEDHCYRLDRTLQSFIAAQNTCERVGASLVSITSAEENAFVADLGLLAEAPFYIGLNDYEAGEGTFRWTDGTTFRYSRPSMTMSCPTNSQPTPTPQTRRRYCTESEMDYSNWNVREPNNSGGQGEDCIQIVYRPNNYEGNGKWNDVPCNSVRYSMCKKDANEEGTVEETSIKCPHSFETFIEKGTPSKSVSWSETTYLGTTNDSIASHVQKSHSPGVELPKGTTLVNYTFRDAHNVSATCNFSISVIEVDTTPPSIKGCPTDVTLVQQRNVPMRVDWNPPTATDVSGNVIVSQSHIPSATFDIGVHSVSYTFADISGNEAECLFKISVYRASYSDEAEVPPTDTQINPDHSVNSNQAANTDDGLHNLISGLYVVVIVIGLGLAVLLLLVIRNRNNGKTQSFVDSKSYSKMDEENLID